MAPGGSWSESTVSGWETDDTVGNRLPAGATPATPAWGDDSRAMSNPASSGRRSTAPTPNPSGSSFPATPAANYAPMTPQASEYPMTPAAGMGGGGFGAPTPGTRYPPQTPAAYSHPTPGAMMPATPAPGSAAVPQTPYASGGLDYGSSGHRADSVATPAASVGGRPSSMASSAAGGGGGGNSSHLPRDWLSRGIVVEVVRATSGAEPVPAKTLGVVLRVLGGNECDIRVLDCPSEPSLINSTQVVPNNSVRPARPARSDQVKLLGPKERGAVGKLIAIDGDDAIVKAGNSSDFVVQPIHFVAKYMEV
ncbi:hypothetical protein H4R35_006047 [Dimargaris xerosporica]|nr:hypothetical protein H4R35_006047 [Dimargaris xerosporica]